MSREANDKLSDEQGGSPGGGLSLVTAAKRILRYLAGTKAKGLVYSRVKSDSQEMITPYSDADWASEKDRISVSGFVTMMAGAPVSWWSRKQSTKAMSSMESELVAASEATR